MYLILTFIVVASFIKDSVTFQFPNVPRIYPQRSDVTVDAYTDLTLGCQSIEPIRWTFRDEVNKAHYYKIKKVIYETVNNNSEYKYELILTVYNVSYINIGFYYCHAKMADFNTARRSTSIYVFVYDENILSVITSKSYTYLNTAWAVQIPCRPASPDITVTLSCIRGPGGSMIVTPSNYSAIDEDIFCKARFHPYFGFNVRHDDYVFISINHCTCVFKRNHTVFRLQMYRENWKPDSFPYGIGTIEGPDTAEVGNPLTLQCAVIQGLYFPFNKHWIEWKIPNDGNNAMTILKKFSIRRSILLINSITMKNTSLEDEGVYSCKLKQFQETSKYVYINDMKTNDTSPRIYFPNGNEIQINAGESITLRCVGVRPVTWRDLGRENTFIEHIPATKNIQYESYLHISNVRYTDTGFYHCYENDSNVWHFHPFKSTKFYIFVKEEQRLYVSQQYVKTHFPYTNVTVPCLPTSRDVNVSLSIVHEVREPHTHRLLNTVSVGNPLIYEYDPREGFTIQLPGFGHNTVEMTATCIFETESASDTLDIDYTIKGFLYNVEPFIIGPHEDLVFVGQTLEMSCSVFVPYNVPDDELHWTHNSSTNEIIVEMNRINFNVGKVLISRMRLGNVEVGHAGRYSCHLDNATAEKDISVYDEFDFKPIIINLQYNSAYIGQPFSLLCNVTVNHNIDFQMSWITPNNSQAKIMKTQYITNVRNVFGNEIVQIDNVTYGDAGTYLCSVFALKNRRKYVTRNIEVKRGIKPIIVKSNFNKLEDMDVLLEETVNLTCFAEGDPKPVITWMKDSREVRRLRQHIGFSSNNSELTVHFVQKIDAGRYTCRAQNPFGEDFRFVTLRVISASTNGWFTGSLIFVIILTAVTAVLLTQNIYRAKKRRKALIKAGIYNFKTGEIHNLNPFLNMKEQASLLPYDNKWEIPRNQIELGKNLGSGTFGLVVKATVSNYFHGEPNKTVAVKMLHPYSNFVDLTTLIDELKILTHTGEHTNLINLLGACTENLGEKTLLVILEYCKHGSLRNYLIENRCNFVNLIDPNTELICFSAADYNILKDKEAHYSGTEPPELPSISSLQLLYWALQVARGMKFLAARKILHGDLAARNILLDDNYVVKISDFGLSKTLRLNGYYKKKSQCPLPIKWMAIESIREKIFSTQSDVWAFGVVLWELFSLARTPYAELEPDFYFYRKLESGYRLERPEYSTREIYQVMRECWCAEPKDRPTFKTLVRTFTDLIRDSSTRCFESDNDDDESLRGECSFSMKHAPASCEVSADHADTTAPDWVALNILTTSET